MKRCSTLLAIREIHIKKGNSNKKHNEIRIHTTRMARINNRNDNKCLKENVEKLKPSHSPGGNVKCHHIPFGKQSSSSSKH